jgi:putative ABC transport system permease protein
MYTTLRVSAFLAGRYIRHSNPWMSLLIIVVMMLTFINLVTVVGILVGFVDGSKLIFRERYSGDVFVSSYFDKKYIESSPRVIETISSLPEVVAYSPRYVELGTAEASYEKRANTPSLVPDTVTVNFVGIDPRMEDATTHLSEKIIAGEYLNEGDEDYVLVGKQMLEQYSTIKYIGYATLSNVYPGTKIRITVGGVSKEFTVKGILKTKIDNVDQKIFFVDRQLRQMIGRADLNVDEIALRLKPGIEPLTVTDALKRSGIDRYALIRTSTETEGTFFNEIEDTFRILGNVIGIISVIVALFTIFIVIFITAITRRKFIGILKGIGITGFSIEASYIMLSVFYTAIGITLGILVIYFFIKPYLDLYPIDFPLSDGILVAPFSTTFWRTVLMMIGTFIAGYVPAHLIVRRNTLDAILGR